MTVVEDGSGISTGHVFASRADLTHLACDDIVVPTDRMLNISDHWLEVLGGRRPQRTDLDVGRLTWVSQRYARFLPAPDDGPRVWLVDTGGTGTESVDWYTDALRNVLEATAALEDTPRHRRERRVTALPLVGVGEGGASAKRGEVIRRYSTCSTRGQARARTPRSCCGTTATTPRSSTSGDSGTRGCPTTSRKTQRAPWPTAPVVGNWHFSSVQG